MQLFKAFYGFVASCEFSLFLSWNMGIVSVGDVIVRHNSVFFFGKQWCHKYHSVLCLSVLLGEAFSKSQTLPWFEIPSRKYLWFSYIIVGVSLNFHKDKSVFWDVDQGQCILCFTSFLPGVHGLGCSRNCCGLPAFSTSQHITSVFLLGFLKMGV